MHVWQVVLGILIAIGGLVALYGLHRLGLWMEQRGWIYYWHKQSEVGAASCFSELQRVIEPQSRHVIQIKDEKRHHSEDEADGQLNPSDSLQPSQPE